MAVVGGVAEACSSSSKSSEKRFSEEKNKSVLEFAGALSGFTDNSQVSGTGTWDGFGDDSFFVESGWVAGMPGYHIDGGWAKLAVTGDGSEVSMFGMGMWDAGAMGSRDGREDGVC